jgi:undecaprenyl-diphosphatase
LFRAFAHESNHNLNDYYSKSEFTMDTLHIVVLALVQGLTEFLPISSEAHLILVPVVTHWQDQGLAFDVGINIGTLSAVVIYFRKELMAMIRDWLVSFSGKHTSDSRLAWMVGIGTIPVGLAGLLSRDFVAEHLRSPLVIATTSIVFGLLLWFSDARGKRMRDEYSLSWKDVLLIGVAQAFALIPGTSRSGVTITAALLLGLNRQGAARFSFLLSIPVIALAGGLEMLDYLQVASITDLNDVLLGALISGVSAYACIHYFLNLLERVGMMPFVIYRLVLGAVLLLAFV